VKKHEIGNLAPGRISWTSNVSAESGRGWSAPLKKELVTGKELLPTKVGCGQSGDTYAGIRENKGREKKIYSGSMAEERKTQTAGKKNGFVTTSAPGSGLLKSR